jgi:hypothetical protein
MAFQRKKTEIPYVFLLDLNGCSGLNTLIHANSSRPSPQAAFSTARVGFQCIGMFLLPRCAPPAAIHPALRAHC